MKKRMISMMLCICILLSLVPVTAFAAEGDPVPEITKVTFVIDGVEYTEGDLVIPNDPSVLPTIRVYGNNMDKLPDIWSDPSGYMVGVEGMEYSFSDMRSDAFYGSDYAYAEYDLFVGEETGHLDTTARRVVYTTNFGETYEYAGMTVRLEEPESEPESAQSRMIYLDNSGNNSGGVKFEYDLRVEIDDLGGNEIECAEMVEVVNGSGVYQYEVQTDRTDVKFVFRTASGLWYTDYMAIPTDENNMFVPNEFIPGGEDEDDVYNGIWTTYVEPEQSVESEQTAEPRITGLHSITVFENVDGEEFSYTYSDGGDIVINENTTRIILALAGTNLDSLVNFIIGDRAPCWVYFCSRMQVALVSKNNTDFGMVYEIDPEAGEAYMIYYGEALHELAWPTETTEIECINNFNSIESERISTGFTIRRDDSTAEPEQLVELDPKPTLTGISVTLNGEEITSGNFTVTTDAEQFLVNFHGTALDQLEVFLKYSIIDSVYNYGLTYNEDKTVATVDLTGMANRDLFILLTDFAAISYGTDENNLVESGLFMKFESSNPYVETMTLLVDGTYYGPGETAYITSVTQSILIEVEGWNLENLSDGDMFELYPVGYTIVLLENRDKIKSQTDSKIVFDLSSWKDIFLEKCTDANWLSFEYADGSGTSIYANPKIQGVNLEGNIVIHAFDDPAHRDGWHGAAIEVYAQEKNEDGSLNDEMIFVDKITVEEYENVISFQYDEHLVYRFKWRQGNHEGCLPGEHDNECSFIIYADSNVVMNTNVFHYEDGQTFLTIAPKKTHQPAEAEITWEIHPTCKQEGKYHHIINCTECEKPFSEDTHIVPVLDHNADYYENGRCTQTCGVEGCTECQTCGEWLFEVETVEMDLLRDLEIAFVIDKDRIPTNTAYILVTHVQADGSKVTRKFGQDDVIDMGDSVAVYYDGLYAKQMMDSIYVAACDVNDVCLSNPESPAYNVWSYISKILDGDYSDEMKTLAADVALYGGAAQDYLGYNVKNLISDQLTKAHMDWATESFTGTITAMASDGKGYAGTNTALLNQINLQYAFKKTTIGSKAKDADGNAADFYAVIEINNVSERVALQEYNSSHWYVSIPMDYLWTMNDMVTVRIYANTDSENPIATVTDSVVTYASRMLDKNGHDLYQYMMHMAQSAEAFNSKQSVIF